MKVHPAAKKITKDDYTARRKGRLYILNKKKPKHKQRQG